MTAILITVGNADGMVLGYFTEDEARLSRYLQESSAYLLEHTPIADLMLIQQRSIAIMTEIAQPDWYKKFLEEQEVYVLQAIIVRESLRGTGVFRKLFAPVLERAEEKKTPIVLQTHELAHVAKYEHMGFKLLETVMSDKLEVA